VGWTQRRFGVKAETFGSEVFASQGNFSFGSCSITDIARRDQPAHNSDENPSFIDHKKIGVCASPPFAARTRVCAVLVISSHIMLWNRSRMIGV
jgi:hypothetical protein